MTKIHEFGESYEMYLKAVRELAQPEGPVPVTALAERLGVATVSASEMVHRLQDQGLIEHEPYKGVRLTGEGQIVADRVLRSHRLWERFLVDSLGLDWAASHDFACELEHLADPQVVDALDTLLGNPDTCPHGNPITEEAETTLSEDVATLDRLEPGDLAIVLAVRPESSSVLEAVREKQLLPGATVELLDIELFDGPRQLLVGGRREVVGVGLASHVVVRRGNDGRE
ncbi:MAG: metal-dependent transcriptional regulator [Anaerolineales bacterium]